MVVEPASVRACVRASVRPFTFSKIFFSETDQSQILCGASMGRGNESLCFLFRSDKNSGCYGNLCFP